ncbi:D-alanyl-D-alanine carboxypeptidase [Alcaligenaceae bacterium CGII-47]|nr:D-alanyl-D-alanine carboxypeptidase [Alcaligenaceae bacterium CGII-47]
MTLPTPTSRLSFLPRLVLACVMLGAPVLATAQTVDTAAVPAASAVTTQTMSVGELSPVPIPALGAKAWLTLDANSGQVIASENRDEKVEPASLTKIMAAYVVFEALETKRLTLDQKVRVSEHAWKTEGSRMFIDPNSEVSIDDLLQGLIVQSGNDATVALAEAVSGSESAFVALMNQEAARQGLTGTHFTNSSGLPDPEHYTTVHDLAILSRNLVQRFPQYLHYYSQREYTYNKIKQSNRNRLLWADQTVDGLKTGHTKSAGYCLVTTALRDGRRVISVLVGAASDAARTESSLKLLNWSFRNFDTVRMIDQDQAAVHAKIWGGVEDAVALGPQQALWVTVPRGREADIQSVAHYTEPLMAPVAKGDTVGTLEIQLEGKILASMPLQVQQDIAQAGFFGRAYDQIRLLFE